MAASALKKALSVGLAAATLAGTMSVAATTAAEARPGGRGGFGVGGRGFTSAPRAFGGGYIQRGPVVGGRFYGGPRYYGGYGYRRGYYGGGAVAAGLVGGLALGALAASPYYGYGYGYGGYAPAYYGYGYGGCHIERRRVYDGFGRIVIQDVEVC